MVQKRHDISLQDRIWEAIEVIGIATILILQEGNGTLMNGIAHAHLHQTESVHAHAQLHQTESVHAHVDHVHPIAIDLKMIA